jgi:hypothetical protein
VKRIIFAGLLVLLMIPVAQAEQYRLDGLMSFISDSDHEKQYIYGLGTDIIFNRRNDDRVSVYAGQREFRNNTDETIFGEKEETFNFISISGGKRFDKLRLDGKLSYYDGEHWHPFLYSFSAAIDPVPLFHFEASAERDFVDSLQAVHDRLHIDSYSGSADLNFAAAWTLVGAYTRQEVSDGNDRDIEWLKLYYVPQSLGWLRLEAYGKHLTSEFRGVGYFSPSKLWEAMAIAQVSVPLAGDKFVLRIRGGLGDQWVENETGNIASLAELKIKGWFSDHWGFDVTGGYTNQSSVITSGSSYSRLYANALLTYAF